MQRIVRSLSAILVIAATIIVGYTIGKRAGKKEGQTMIIDNYAFVREIAELSTLEVDGVTTFKSSNISPEDKNSWAGSFKKMFLEKTVQIQAPFIAKYGVDLNDSSLQIKKTKDGIEIHLPKPKLLSYELRLDRMQTSNQKGWLLFQDDEMYASFQKKMYRENRAQLETNSLYLNRAEDRVCGILRKYFNPLQIKTDCIFDRPALTKLKAQG